MYSRKTLALLSLLSTTSASGCYGTFDLTPQSVAKLNGFRAGYEVGLQGKDNEEVVFTEKTELSFLGADGAVAEATFNRIDIQGNILIGEESRSGEQLYVDLSRMSAVRAEKISIPGTVMLAGLGTAGLLAGSVLAVFIFGGGIGGGRPLRVAGQTETVRAPLMRARHRNRHVRAHMADEATRQAILTHWANEASAECASIPAFLALARDLEKVGAPRGLVEAALRAAREEATHTNLCLALANAHADQPIMTRTPAIPTSTDIDREALLQRLTLEAFWDGSVAEGSAAVVAQRSAVDTRDDATRLALQTIARDEANHAELARLIVAYGLSAGGPALRRALHESFESKRAHEEALLGRNSDVNTESSADQEFAQGYGVAGDDVTREARIEAWEKSVSLLARV
jgi:hypothetical protein